MTKLGYKKGGDGMWVDASDAKPDMKIAVPDWLKNYGPPLSTQLRDAGFDASFDTSPGLDSQVQTGQQPLYFGCQGPAGSRSEQVESGASGLRSPPAQRARRTTDRLAPPK